MLLLLLFALNVKGEWVDSDFQIIDLLVPPRAAGFAGTLIFCLHCKFCYTTTLAACRIFYLSYFEFTVYAQGTRTFMCPSATQSYVIKLSCSRKVLAASGD